jgi:hypothetical protein
MPFAHWRTGGAITHFPEREASLGVDHQERLAHIAEQRAATEGHLETLRGPMG